MQKQTHSKDQLFDLGKNAILAATRKQRGLIERAGITVLTTEFQSAHIFEIALRRVGEIGLTEELVDKTPDITKIVRRKSANSVFLDAVIACLQRGEIEFAREIETRERETFYIPNIPYICPHMYAVTRSKLDSLGRERLAQLFLEDSGRKGFYEDLGGISISETIYALYANLALGNVEHAKEILQTLVKIYLDTETVSCKTSIVGAKPNDRYNYSKWSFIATMLRAIDIIDSGKASEMYAKFRKEILETSLKELKKDEYDEGEDSYFFNKLINLVFSTDQFNDDELSNFAREQIYLLLENKINFERFQEVKDNFHLGRAMDENTALVKFGLGLVGLERANPNWFYLH